MINRTSFLILALALLMGQAHAQLSGAYSIDNSLPTGGINYATFQDAANDLTAQGVSGAVTFAVSPSATPYAGFSLNTFTGMGAANPVTFIALGGAVRPVINTPAAGFSHGIRLGTSTAASSVGLGPQHVTVEGFEITGIGAGAGITVVGGVFCTIRNCVVHACGSGIGFVSTTDSIIEDCEVYNTQTTPASPNSTSYSGGLSVYYLSDRNIVQRNRVHDCVSNGIFVGSSGSTTHCQDNQVINNMIWNCGTQTSNTYAGSLAFRRATNSIVANNTISVPLGSQKPGIYVMATTATSPLGPLLISSNLIQSNDPATPCIAYDVAAFATTLDNNAYDAAGGGPIGGIGTSITTLTQYATLANWQTITGAEALSAVGPANFVSPTDLHITPASVAFNIGATLAQVTLDIDFQPRPLAGINDAGCDEVTATGLFAGFTASTTSGPAALTVNFMDSSFTSDPGGVLTWAWDVDGDTVIDYTTQNPSHTYTCPGSYDVSLTVTDASNPTSTTTLTNYITVTDYAFQLSNSGPGVADLTIMPVPALCYPAATAGYTLISLSTTLPLGAGPIFGIAPDAFTLIGINSPRSAGNALNFFTTAGTYPNTGPLVFPAGFFAPLVGQTLDACEVLVDNSGNIVYYSNVARISF